jgi:hypothetical protein
MFCCYVAVVICRLVCCVFCVLLSATHFLCRRCLSRSPRKKKSIGDNQVSVEAMRTALPRRSIDQDVEHLEQRIRRLKAMVVCRPEAVDFSYLGKHRFLWHVQVNLAIDSVVFSVHQRGPIMRSDRITHCTYTLRLLWTCSIMARGFSLSQILQLWRFTTPHMWKVASSGKRIQWV